MSIRVRTLKAFETSRRQVYRVRWRVCVPQEKGQPWRADTDGEPDQPQTWARCEEELFSLLGYATAAAGAGWLCEQGVRPAGCIDHLPARVVLARLEREGQPLTEWDLGRLRRVGCRQVNGCYWEGRGGLY